MKRFREILTASLLTVISSSAAMTQNKCILVEYQLFSKRMYISEVYDDLYECARHDPRLRDLSIEIIELIGEGISEAAAALRGSQAGLICHPEGRVSFSYSEWREFLLKGKEILSPPARRIEQLLLVGATSVYPCN